jgi:hypothetical protein
MSWKDRFADFVWKAFTEERKIIVNPIPDRSKYQPRKEKEDGVLDIGWQIGILSNRRYFRAEYWCEDGVSCLTFFMSTLGIENASKEYFENLLTKDNLINFYCEERYIGLGKFIDDSGNEMWSVNVILADDENLFASSELALNTYK